MSDFMGNLSLGAQTAKDIGEAAKAPVDIWATIEQTILAKKKQKSSEMQFDKQFEEASRQFGIDFALKDYATRKGLALNDVRSMLDAQQTKTQGALAAENLKTSALGRNIQSQQFEWQAEDRRNKKAIGKALQKGLISGLMGGK